MLIFPSRPRKATARDKRFFANPRLWPTWPFLAVVRYHGRGEMDYGVLYDAFKDAGRTGYSATVFLTNLFLLPPTVEALLELPKEVYDTVEELAEAGWVVD